MFCEHNLMASGVYTSVKCMCSQNSYLPHYRAEFIFGRYLIKNKEYYIIISISMVD